jgi:hypothetical protein
VTAAAIPRREYPPVRIRDPRKQPYAIASLSVRRTIRARRYMRPRTWPARCPRVAWIGWRDGATGTCRLCRRCPMLRASLKHGTGFPDTGRDAPIRLKSNTHLQLLCTICWPRVQRQGVDRRRRQVQIIGRTAVPIVCYPGNPNHISFVRQNSIVSTSYI